jgi:hypothetical protein
MSVKIIHSKRLGMECAIKMKLNRAGETDLAKKLASLLQYPEKKCKFCTPAQNLWVHRTPDACHLNHPVNCALEQVTIQLIDSAL